MRLHTIPNQSSVPKAFLERENWDRMKPCPFYDRVIGVVEELIKFALLTRGCAEYQVDCYSERKQSAEKLSQRVNQSSV